MYHFVYTRNGIIDITPPSLSAGGFLPLAVPLALRTDVIPQHRSQNEVFFRRKQIERAVRQKTDGPDALRTAEEQVDARVGSRLHQEVDVLAPQAGGGKGFVLAVDRIEYHAAHTFLILVHVVQKHLQVCREDVGG